MRFQARSGRVHLVHEILMMRSFAIIILLACTALAASAAEVEVIARLERTQIYLGEQVGLYVDARGARNAPQPKLTIPGVDVTFAGDQPYSSSKIQVINGQMFRDEKFGTRMQFILRPTQAGVIAIPGIPIESDGKTFTSQPLTLSVVKAEEQELVILQEEVDPASEVYVDQPIKVRLNILIRKRQAGGQQDPFISNQLPHMEIPWFDSCADWQTGDLQAFAQPLVRRHGELGFTINNYRQQAFFETVPHVFQFPRTDVTQRCADGRDYQYLCYTLEKEFRPATVGEYTVPGVLFKGTVRLDAGARAIIASSPSVKVSVRQVPAQDRPDTFTGAIGSFTFEADATPKAAKVGDPIDLILSVTGDGVLEKILPLDLTKQTELTQSFRVYADAPSVNVTGTTKTFRYTVRAKDETVSGIPPIAFSYFDVRANQYRTLRSKPVKVSISPTATMKLNEVELPGGQSYSRLGKELEEGILANFTGDDVLANQEFEWKLSLGLLALLIVPPVGFAAVFIAGKRSERLKSDPALVRSRAARKDAFDRLKRLQGLADASPEFCGELSKVLTFYVADKLNVPREGFTTDDLRRSLRDREIDPALADAATDLVTTCDSGRFGGGHVSGNAEMIRNARELVNRLEKAF